MTYFIKTKARLLTTLFFIITLFYATIVPLGYAQESTTERAGQAADSAGLFEDPEGRFTVPIPTNWQAETREGYIYLTDPDKGVNAYILVTTGEGTTDEDLPQVVAESWKVVDPSFDAPVKDTASPPPSDGLEEVVIINYETAPDRFAQGTGQRYKGNVYVLLSDFGRGKALAFRRQLQRRD